MKAMIEAGAAGVHFEDQLASEKKCGHMGGKVLVPTSQFIRTLTAARLAADVMDVPTLLVARTDADSAKLLTSDVDERDRAFLTGERTAGGLLPRCKGGLECAIARGLAYAPYADLLWCETSHAGPGRGAEVRRGHPREVPGQAAGLQLLARRSTGRRTWTTRPSPSSSASWGRWATSSSSSRWPASTPSTTPCSSWPAATGTRGMAAYSELQQAEFASREGRLHRHAPPARGRHRLLRPGGPGHLRRPGQHPGAAREHRGAPVLEQLSGAALESTSGVVRSRRGGPGSSPGRRCFL